jgi:hypothetical protein
MKPLRKQRSNPQVSEVFYSVSIGRAYFAIILALGSTAEKDLMLEDAEDDDERCFGNFWSEVKET